MALNQQDHSCLSFIRNFESCPELFSDYSKEAEYLPFTAKLSNIFNPIYYLFKGASADNAANHRFHQMNLLDIKLYIIILIGGLQMFPDMSD